MLDQTDTQILSLLTKNSRMQWQEIGEEVHLTGQAVKNRISKMEKSGVIKNYTVNINPEILGKNLTAFITVFMKTTDHLSFKKYINNNSLVTEAHRISGDGCYILKLTASTQAEIVDFLDEILKYGNYKLNLSIQNIK
ncbi:Lrp/AsnC family transcriptional regulator [Clostridium estertheticum]|uniref:Transcriptional regulator n=1 Tax=Clostridium estertheticum subsp. estertheticum TaxID=1552 RepID=A0A1J0GI92_9CLOT|nr:Lrp/AsnC family transcriptional regulator [Clostridium estertheticum]APC41098.1 transcriptional regulator [Clostridium estertheticum subsp. estertheticum]MBU3074103.1 Lrp/AsnC family transcriptional regulator [Clostridium estertheticum]MBU3164197.1 Lrp/AsnC family transcriptional regulator [Clostridium estertheticum]MBU3186078.1 Lrp/AsnC family transcriptional regulator [Clostridium estertheticum]MBZ9617090.1 Lrp/AsnC family transcriptional regulator [Clostridium estertheticum subsp. larami